MTATLDLTAPTAPAAGRGAPSLPRRAAVGAAGLLACALPLVWGCASVVMLATGTEADHRFHQVTGQGVLLAVLWLAALLPLVRAGLRGRRPSTTDGLRHLSFLAVTAGAAALAPEAGAGPVAVITLVTGGLLWAALPSRPRLRGAFRGGLDPVLAPLALLAAALVTPFALAEADLQHAMADEHAEMAHYFDMAWVTFALVGLLAVAAVHAGARRLAVWGSAGLVVTGAARAAFTPDVTWSATAVALGAAGIALGLLRSRSARTAA